MGKEYRHIQQYEEEMLKLKAKGMTKKEIEERLGFSKKQIHNFITRYNEKQRRIQAGVSLKVKGRLPNENKTDSARKTKSVCCLTI